MAYFTGQTKKIEANIGVISRIILQGGEKKYRNFKCKEILNLAKSIKTLIHKNTMEIVKTVPLFQADRQSSIPL